MVIRVPRRPEPRGSTTLFFTARCRWKFWGGTVVDDRRICWPGPDPFENAQFVSIDAEIRTAEPFDQKNCPVQWDEHWSKLLKKLMDFFDKSLLQRFDFERFLIVPTIPFERKAL